MYCTYCGKEIDDRAEICPHCGIRVRGRRACAMPDDAPSAGFAFLCFFVPILGLILYIIWKDEYPMKAASCGKGALLSVILGAVFTIFYIIMIVSIAGCIAAGGGM